MMQILDRFRKEYEKETGDKYSWIIECRDETNKKYRYETMPSWNYVCWLENRIASHEGFMEEIPTTITTASTFKGAENGDSSSVKG